MAFCLIEIRYSHHYLSRGGQVAQPIVRPCIVCGKDMTTIRASKRHCSNRCYMQMHRAAKRKLIDLNAINPQPKPITEELQP